jgi:hypothetical protein
LLALRNVLHGGVVDASSPGGDNLLRTMWRMTDMALSGVLLWSGALLGEVANTTTVEADVAGGGSNGRWCV